MATITQDTGARRELIWRWTSVIVTAVVMGLSVAQFLNLLGKHTIGAEIYGVVVAFLSAVAGVSSLSLLLSPRRQKYLLIAVLVLWAIVALGGIAGSVAHVIGPDLTGAHGPVDGRPRPIAAPLVFTLFGIVGGSALFLGQRRKSDV